MDKIDKYRRSRNMSRIKGKNTMPELIARRYLYANGIRYRLHADLPGKPDLLIKTDKIAVFVNGCFWHGHRRCGVFRLPKSNRAFWKNKIGTNQKRDRKNYGWLRKYGWNIYIVWECQLDKNPQVTLKRTLEWIISHKRKPAKLYSPN